MPAIDRAHHPLGEPFPLRRGFARRVLPILLLFVAVVVISTGYTVREVVQSIYLELAAGRAQGIAAGVERIAPDDWRALLEDRAMGVAAERRLQDAFAEEVDEFHLERLKVYDLTGRTIFDTDEAQIGRIERNVPLAEAVRTGESRAVVETTVEGESSYELYVPYRRGGRAVAIFELYEPVGFLDGILLRSGLVAAAMPALLLVVLLAFLFVLVRRAQTDIDRRTHEINSLRLRLATLVSRTAAKAVEGSEHGLPKASREVCTLLFTDLRSFTSFAEKEDPEHVVATLDRVLGRQVRRIERWGGDVDKMLGDGLFARFHGRRTARRAVGCALAIQRDVLRAKEASRFGVGIGIFSGPVVMGAMGSGGRLDFTGIGDSVNVASRLCGLAAAGEVVCDAETAAQSGLLQGAPAERVTLKGREGSISVVRRMTPAASKDLSDPAGERLAAQDADR